MGVQIKNEAFEYMFRRNISPLNDILHKCDLGVEMRYHEDIEKAFTEGAEWMMDKAVEWLKSHINDYLVFGRDIDLMFDDLTKALK